LRWLKRRRSAASFFVLAAVAACYMLYFFRDPPRSAPSDPNIIVAGADGVVMGVKEFWEDQYFKTNAVRVSIFLSLFDVHVNRAPIGGKIEALKYSPGKRYFTFEEKSSEFNQHNSILIAGAQTRCLVKQIVGPVARRVVHWLETGQVVEKGERIGMMKFGSRLDMIFPSDEVDVVIRLGDRVQAGVTVIGTIKSKR